ncbi:glycosyltransferase family 2 protein [Agromyces soli]|uniref:Glycosyltransferase n=1 Tax=Agromyces soli TaxID=659012 RepID=A0ABY4AU80_9MICO|nr:glycosyltransferase [Agromyces soli]UOE26724.1 glycosyltransferase [Agromyces soli]
MLSPRRTRRLAASLSLLAIVLCVGGVWWLNGGPNWYGVLAVAIVAVKTLLNWGGRDAASVSGRERSATDDLDLTVAVPCYNEDPELLARTLESLLRQTRAPQSVTVIDDGSVDRRAVETAHAWEAEFRRAGVRFAVIVFPENRGKRHALVAALDAHPEADVLLGVDSDSLLRSDAIAEGLAGLADPRVMVSTGMVLPSNPDTNLLTRMQDVRYASAFLFDRAAFSSIGAVLCACGTIAFYRTSMMRKYQADFLDQRFLGRPATLGDDRRMTNYALLEGRSVLRARAIAFTTVPERVGHFARQQVRWHRSYFRESFWALLHQPIRRPAFWLTLVDLGVWFLFATVLIAAIVSHAATAAPAVLAFYLAYMVLLGYARAVRYFEVASLRPRRSDVVLAFLLTPMYTVLHLVFLFWLRPYALLTLGYSGWGTRKSVEVRAGEQATGASGEPARNQKEATA